MSQSVLVLGASGFIGRHLTRAIAATGQPVLAATRHPVEFGDALIENVCKPFQKADDFLSLLARCSVVIHAASSTTPGSSSGQPLLELDENLRPTLALIEALQQYPNRRLVFLSSGGTLYGDYPQGGATESSPLRPRSYHAAGKCAAEQFFHAWANQYAGTAISLRPSNVYGPGQSLRAGFGIVPMAFDRALRRLPMDIWGDGSATRDYLHVDDLVAVCLTALQGHLPTGLHSFNVGSGDSVSLTHLLDAIDGITGRPLARRYLPSRAVDVHRIALDSSAARATFDWQPRVSLEQGLRGTWQWFSTQR